MADPKEFSSRSIDALGLSPPVRDALRDIQADIAEGYREGFLQQTETLKQMVSTLARIQSTLSVLVEHIEPRLKEKLPVAIQQVAEGGTPDLATAFVVADPIGMGFTLSQRDLATALNISAPEVSILARAFGLENDGRCAVTVRRGKSKIFVNYHPRAVERFVELVASPPSGLNESQKRSLERVRKKLITTKAVK